MFLYGKWHAMLKTSVILYGKPSYHPVRKMKSEKRFKISLIHYPYAGAHIFN